MSRFTLPSPYSAESLFDSRVVERHIAEGRTTEAAYKAYLASLPDETEECLQSDLKFVVRGRSLSSGIADEDES
jgi:hypothetical protein